MAQQLIDIGGAPNDGEGNPIRDAFAKTNVNFTQLFERYQPPPGNSFGILGDVAGMYAFSANTFYYCYADYTGNTAIWASIPDVGNINQLLNGTSNITIAAADGNIVFWVDGQQTAIFSNTSQSFYVDTSVSGNITASQSVVANVLSVGAGNLQIANNTIYSDADIIIDPFNDGGNSVGNLIIRGNVSVLGNVEFVDVTTSYTSNLLWVAAESANTAALANGAGLAVGPVGNYYGSFTYSSVEDAWRTAQAIIPAANSTSSIGTSGVWWNSAFIDTVEGNTINLAGNINANGAVFSGNILADNFTANVFVANALAANGLILTGDLEAANVTAVANVTADTLVGNAASINGNIDSTGNVNAAGANISGNVKGNNLLTNGIISSAGNVNTAGNLNAATANLSGNVNAVNINVTGIISTSGNIIGEGGNISNITGSSVVGQVANALLAGTVYEASQPNITSVGVLSSLSVTGIISTSGNIIGEGGNISNITGSNVTGNVASAIIANTITNPAQPNITSVGVLSSLSVTGVVTAGGANLGIGNAVLGNVNATGVVSATTFIGNFQGNISGNVSVPGSNTYVLFNNNGNIGAVSGFTYDSGNNVVNIANIVNAAYFAGNGSSLSGIVAANITGIVANANYATFAGNAIRANTANTIIDSAQPNITSVGTLSALAVSTNISANNISVGNNVNVGGNLSVTGNINLSGNVTQITGNSGQFYGDANGFGALYAGVTSYTPIPQTVIQVTANYDEYAQINIENVNSGPKASADYIATADAGTNTTYYADLGISSSTWDGSSANNIGNVISALDTYLYAQGGGNATAPGGNLIIAAPTPSRSIKIAVGGGNTGNIVALISNTGIAVTGIISATSNVTGANINGTGANITGNIKGDNLLTTGLVSATGNVTGNVLFANQSSITGNVTSGNLLTTGLVSATGNVTGANINGAGASITGNVTSGNLLTTGLVSATGNVTSGNLVTTGLISATGNITGDVFVGNGAGLTNINSSNIVGAYGNSNVAANLAAFGNNTISTTGNITAGNTSVVGNVTAAFFLGNGSQLTGLPAGYGNANLANIGANAISTTGNISAAYFVGNGSALTGLPASYGNANLANIGANVISTTGNISGGNINTGGNVVGGNIIIGNTSNLWIGNSVFTRTVTVGRNAPPVVTCPMASNNSFNVLSANGANVNVVTT